MAEDFSVTNDTSESGHGGRSKAWTRTLSEPETDASEPGLSGDVGVVHCAIFMRDEQPSDGWMPVEKKLGRKWIECVIRGNRI